MAYTIEQAKLELKNLTSNSTLDDIRNIINNLDVTDIKASKDAKTVLYSGMGSSFPESLANNPDVRIINNTQAFPLVPNVHVGNAYKNKIR